MTTVDDLEDQLDEDLAWRRAELQSLRAQIRASSQGPSQRILCRVGVALLYAHWEGYTKLALERYLKFVSKRKLRVRELNPSFVSRALEATVRRMQSKTENAKSIERIKWIIDKAEHRAHIPTSNEIDTGSNLNSEVCRELFLSLGLDFAPLETKENLIDYSLLATRNAIAHGENRSIEKDDYEALHGEVLKMISAVRNIVRCAASDGQYRRTADH